MNLVQGENGGGRVVDRRRKPLGGDVHNDAKGEGRVLLQGAFLADGDRLAEGHRPAGLHPVLENAEQRVTDRDEVADLGHHFNDAVSTLGQGHESRDVEGQDHAVPMVSGSYGKGSPSRIVAVGPAPCSVPRRDASDRRFR